MNLPILPTTMVGSYSMPGWLERLKTEYFARRISRVELDEIHDTVVKAAIKDQEIAGLDIVTDGELRRDNMIDYFVERLPGVQVDRSSKKFYYDFYDSEVIGKIPMARCGPRRRLSIPACQHRPGNQDLHNRAALADEADSQQALPKRGGPGHRYRARDEYGAEGTRQSRREIHSDRRAILFGFPRGY